MPSVETIATIFIKVFKLVSAFGCSSADLRPRLVGKAGKCRNFAQFSTFRVWLALIKNFSENVCVMLSDD